ncbi:MAG: molybdopterin-dependent oxidoreductase [Cellvibrionaceae bacterium]|nr:molybdopterin-dependent oxidoreductase [Cellvibrionaceae bacterium]
MSEAKMPIARRSFLKMMGAGGLLLAMPAAAGDKPYLYSQAQALNCAGVLQISPAGVITFFVPRAEMGQGINTGLATLIAEELNTPPEQIQILHGGAHEDYKNPIFDMQVTGGSTSIYAHYQPLRQTAAMARELLLDAASEKLNMDRGSLHLRDGKIWLASKAYSLGDFVELAQTLPAPQAVNLKPQSKFRFIGQYNKRLDAMAKITGQARFGIDVGSPQIPGHTSVINNSDANIPNLKKAALLRCPVIGGTVKSHNGDELKSLHGVVAVVEIFNGVAVLAEHHWQAKKALTQLVVQWQLPELVKQSSPAIRQQFNAALDQRGQQAFTSGDTDAVFAGADKIITADYYAPFLAHATMEPMNCTVWLQKDVADVWVPTQAPDLSQAMAAEFCDVKRDNIRVHSTYMGGGFGRRSNQDYVAEAVAIAKASGEPVQLLFSREDDIQNDYYRPASAARYRAVLDSQGRIQAWDVNRVGPNIMAYTVDHILEAVLPQFIPNAFADWLSKRGYGVFEDWKVDSSSVEGLWEDYDCANKQVWQTTVDPGLRLGYWRSVGHSFSGFFTESFIDELALAAGQDPLAFRLAHTKNNPRLAAVLNKVAQLSNWQQRAELAAKGRYLGLASVFSFNSYVAQVAELSIVGGQPKVHKVYCVADCGQVVNPDTVKAQMEGGIVFALSAALNGEITLKDGAVEQSNFHDYPLLRLNESPEVEVAIVPSSEAPSGAGEPGVPPLAAAVANAIFAASGKRLRDLPLRLS